MRTSVTCILLKSAEIEKYDERQIVNVRIKRLVGTAIVKRI